VHVVVAVALRDERDRPVDGHDNRTHSVLRPLLAPALLITVARNKRRRERETVTREREGPERDTHKRTGERER